MFGVREANNLKLMREITIELNNLTDCVFGIEKLKKAALETVGFAGIETIHHKELDLSVAFVDEDEMRRVNKDYRKKDSATDVLSFAEFEKKEDLENCEDEKIYLGEIVMCPAYIRKYAAEEKADFQKEFTRAFSHSLLHLMGWEHGEEMFAIQDKVAQKY